MKKRWGHYPPPLKTPMYWPPSRGALIGVVRKDRCSTNQLYHMRIKLPGQPVVIRLFERVETKDSQYDVFDTGFEYTEETTKDGNPAIDSIVTGISAHSAKKWAQNMDDKAAEKKAEEAKPKSSKKAKKAKAAAAA